MNRGLLAKSVYETAGMTLAFAVGLALFEALVSYVFWIYQDEFTGDFLQIEFFQDMINAMVGGNSGSLIGPGSLSSLAWVHPFVLSMVFAVAVIVCTRVPAGEIDRGTIDTLFTLPVSRWQIYLAESIVWLGAGMVVVIFAFLGSTLGYLGVPAEERPTGGRLVIIVVNLYALYLAVGGLSFLVSSLSDRRGRAIGAIFGVLMALFMWGFVAQYWEAADRVSFLNILTYYRPMPILSDGVFPARDIAVLLACAVSMWAVGGVVLARRDICTV